MDFGYADKAIISWSDSQQRYELELFEDGSSVHKWILPPGFSAPEAEIMPRWLGIEEINARLADAKVNPAGSSDWELVRAHTWVHQIVPRRTRNDRDH